MEEKRTYKRRTREEVMAWLQRARERCRYPRSV